ncbi:3'(2'),5'-bisphosphate nucleotidase CysQ [Williamsia phyllosphaerae]|uniref:3'(2'),5'-bisphosphate nucleotidase CysQ n=1 Tax=Williamsia phyllosphaerae TaxID=885042 RepID=A0ABQ1V254_9NOCA|nr:3'(2'),5'-bisphosphate nucleotidase CysQ [Williamsia phyllosphaerae]GGF34778.1 3'(2'),5'-bisphosphate nucleotidase CysQ [Williamsia phyllosphaerae]
MGPARREPIGGASSPGGLSDAELAALIADGAGRILVAARHESLLRGRLLGDVGDGIAQAWIASVLRTHRPADAVLSEEAPDSRDRLGSSRVWIIDPLDGTREYAAGRDDWAVHVALTIDGEPADCAVSLPATGEVFRTDTVVAPATPSGRLVTSRYGGSYEAALVANRLSLSAYSVGSAGAKAMAVVRGDADVYVHATGQYEWDNCAPVGVALAAGLHCSRIDGSPLVYNQRSSYMSDFLICRTELAADIIEMLAFVF